MAFDKLVDSAKLEMEMTATAVAIRNKTGLSETIPWEDNTGFANAVAAITVGGGSSEDVRYVTFMNEDGTMEYGKKPTAVGDDCADPIAREVFDTPTKDSTAQYNYTFGGWATTPGGGIDANALKAVTEDRTVYANFISALRYYTIMFYDSDGVTVLKTERLVYGAMPSYMPTKDGFTFDGWSPELSAVTDDASYSAKWIEKITFAGSSWADIARIAESGQTADYFAIDDERYIPVTISGKEYSFKAKIVGMNHDDLSDGSGKAGLSIMFFTVPDTKYKYNSSDFSSGKGYAECTIKETAESFKANLPSDLQAVIKKVKKQYNKVNTTTVLETDAYMWIPSYSEAGHNPQFNATGVTLGSKYPAFNYGYGYTGSKNEVKNQSGSAISGLWVRDCHTSSGTYPVYYVGGSITSYAKATSTNYLGLGFCI